MSEKELFIGIDLNNEYAQISYYSSEMQEPETISTIAGSEIYQIPIAIYKKKEIGQWYFGRDAKKAAAAEGGFCVEHIWNRALAKEDIVIEDMIYPARDILTVFFRKILMLPRRMSGEMKIALLGITLENQNKENTALCTEIMEKIGIGTEQFFVMDYKECFYYYVLNQKRDLWIHDTVLFSYENHNLKHYYLKRKTNTNPQMIDLTEIEHGELSGDRDLEFQRIAEEVFAGNIVSAVYLVGEGFEGDWMKQSLRVLCNGRKAFLGKNLYSKGVCFAACVKGKVFPWPYVYIGDNELKYNISLKVQKEDEVQMYSVLSAGANWYEAKEEIEVILDDSKTVDFWLQYPLSQEAKVESLELTDLPERENKTTRLRITLTAESDVEVRVTIKDLGFGELVKGSDKFWEYLLKM